MSAWVTILIPTWNRHELVQKAVATALGQTYPKTRVLVFDDGSTDATKKLARKWEGLGVTYARQVEQRGVSRARNSLLDLCDTEYACWLDSDDLSNKYRVELLMAAMKKWDPPFVRSSFGAIRGWKKCDGKRKPPEFKGWLDPPEIKYPNRHACATALFKMKCAPRFKTDLLNYSEDVIWESEMVLAHGTGILLQYVLYYVVRGHHHRLSAGRKRSKHLAMTTSNDRALERYKAHIWPKLLEKNINPRCRIERVPPGAIETPFPVPALPETNWQLPPIYVNANLVTAGRYKEV